MKCLGLLGGDNLDANTSYGRRISEEVFHRFGLSHAPRLVSINMHTPELSASLCKSDSKSGLALLNVAAESLVRMGAEAIVPCSSGLQMAYEHLTLDVRLIAMPDAVGAALQTLKIRRVGLIGATSEKEEIYWRRRLARNQVLDVFAPMHRDREHLAHLSIMELRLGVVNQTARADVGRIVYSLRQAGARAVLLLAPELGLALSHLDPVLPVLDATELHALAALEWSLNSPP